MSILEKLPATYRFTDADVDRGFEIFGRLMEDKPVSDEEEQLSDYALKAENMRHFLKRWPTVIEVAQQFQCEAEEAEKRRVNSFTPEAQKKYWEEKKRQEHAKQRAE